MEPTKTNKIKIQRIVVNRIGASGGKCEVSGFNVHNIYMILYSTVVV